MFVASHLAQSQKQPQQSASAFGSKRHIAS